MGGSIVTDWQKQEDDNHWRRIGDTIEIISLRGSKWHLPTGYQQDHTKLSTSYIGIDYIRFVIPILGHTSTRKGCLFYGT